jgi:hypothetical protein
VLSTPRLHWQRGCVERVIGSIRRGYLDQVIMFDEFAAECLLPYVGLCDFHYKPKTLLHVSIACCFLGGCYALAGTRAPHRIFLKDRPLIRARKMTHE